MRAIPTAAACVLISAGLFGCDQSTTIAPKSTGAESITAALPAPQAAAPYRHHRRRAPRYARNEQHGYLEGYSRGYSQSPWSADSETPQEAQEGFVGERRDWRTRQHARPSVWIDSYGRAHGGAEPERVAADDRARHDPWHGYDRRCRDD